MMILLFGAKIQNKCLWQLKSEPNCRKKSIFHKPLYRCFCGANGTGGNKKTGQGRCYPFYDYFCGIVF
jgi:hypothetical protein